MSKHKGQPAHQVGVVDSIRAGLGRMFAMTQPKKVVLKDGATGTTTFGGMLSWQSSVEIEANPDVIAQINSTIALAQIEAARVQSEAADGHG